MGRKVGMLKMDFLGLRTLTVLDKAVKLIKKTGDMLTQCRFMNVKNARNDNSRYVRCKIEDFTGLLESMMWPDEFARANLRL